MGYIARLPEAVFNSLRSSTILSDFSQIVEELVSNSIDAGSTKMWTEAISKWKMMDVALGERI